MCSLPQVAFDVAGALGAAMLRGVLHSESCNPKLNVGLVAQTVITQEMSRLATLVTQREGDI